MHNLSANYIFMSEVTVGYNIEHHWPIFCCFGTRQNILKTRMSSVTIVLFYIRTSVVCNLWQVQEQHNLCESKVIPDDEIIYLLSMFVPILQKYEVINYSNIVSPCIINNMILSSSL